MANVTSHGSPEEICLDCALGGLLQELINGLEVGRGRQQDGFWEGSSGEVFDELMEINIG